MNATKPKDEQAAMASRLAKQLRGKRDCRVGVFSIREIYGALMPCESVLRIWKISKADVLRYGCDVLESFDEAGDDVPGWIHKNAHHPELFGLGVCVDEFVEMFKTFQRQDLFSLSPGDLV